MNEDKNNNIINANSDYNENINIFNVTNLLNHPQKQKYNQILIKITV